MTIKSYIKSGNSFPVILDDKEKTYFVKLRAGMSGKHALANEWIGNKIGIQLNIKTQTPIWIELENGIIIENVHIEVKELIHKSLGLNIGFEYQEHSTEIKGNELHAIDENTLKEFFLFDLMMINIDRTSNNTNLMKVEDEILSIDYESSLLLQDSMGDKKYLESDGILKCFKNSPLYKEIDEASIHGFLRKSERISFEDIISEIPLSILGKDERSSFLEGIKKKKKNNWFLSETIEKLKAIEIETEEQRKNRMNKNQEKFKRNLKNSASNNVQKG